MGDNVDFQDEVFREAREKVKEIESRITAPGIAILGKTGTGKSSLVNSIFGVNTTKTGIGRPITQHYQRFPKELTEDTNIILFDSPGYEIKQWQKMLGETVTFLNERSAYKVDQEVSEPIHLVWYVINAGSPRIEDFDTEVLETVMQLGIPLVVILSQCDRASFEERNALKEIVEDELRKLVAKQRKAQNNLTQTDYPVQEVSLKDKEKPLGLWDLVEVSLNLLPPVLSDGLIRAQQVNIKAKRSLAWSIIMGQAATCFGIAFVPVPGAAPASIIACQIAGIVALVNLYNAKEFFKSFLGATSLTGQAMLTVLGAGLLDAVSNALLWIPGFGWTGYGAASAAAGLVGTAYIVVSGLATIRVLEILYERNLIKSGVTDYTRDLLQKIFKEVFENIQNQVPADSIRSREDINKINYDRILDDVKSD